MLRFSRLAKSLAIVGAIVALQLGAALPAQAAVTLDDGHVDGAWIKFVNNAVEVWVGDHTGGGTIERNPADVILRAKPESQKSVPNPARPACLGTPGNPVWILPQVEDPNLLWLGWSAQSITSGVVDGNQVTLKVKSVTPPTAGAGFCVYTRSPLGVATVLFYNLDGLPDSVTIPTGPSGHRHVNWAFTASGTWTVKFEVTTTVGGVLKSSGEKTYTFSVG